MDFLPIIVLFMGCVLLVNALAFAVHLGIDMSREKSRIPGLPGLFTILWAGFTLALAVMMLRFYFMH